MHVTLIDRNHHLFASLLYQVATTCCGIDIAYPLRKLFHRDENALDVKMAEIAAINPATGTVTADRRRRGRPTPSRPARRANFFLDRGCPGEHVPAVLATDAQQLRSRA